MDCAAILEELRKNGKEENRQGMARYGINVERACGVSIPFVRTLAKQVGKSHDLAQELWKSRVHEARILAAFIEVPGKVTPKQMDTWAADFDSWDICDGVCNHLFSKTLFAHEKAKQWAASDAEYVKRAGFSLMTSLAVHDKKATDAVFRDYLKDVLREATDKRNMVKKAVNWALRQIGKRNLALNAAAIRTAERIRTFDSRAARWIASDALRELTSDKVQERLAR